MKKKTRNMMFGLAAVFVLAVAGVAAYLYAHRHAEGTRPCPSCATRR